MKTSRWVVLLSQRANRRSFNNASAKVIRTDSRATRADVCVWSAKNIPSHKRILAELKTATSSRVSYPELLHLPKALWITII